MVWIRSQDKEVLTECEDFEILKRQDGVYGIHSYHHLLGAYSTEEKALKVLDDIQLQICLNKACELKALIISRKDKVEVGTRAYVYQMPQDDEVEL